jgi:hypothetical protein
MHAVLQYGLAWAIGRGSGATSILCPGRANGALSSRSTDKSVEAVTHLAMVGFAVPAFAMYLPTTYGFRDEGAQQSDFRRFLWSSCLRTSE